ncbi:MAG TPA: hypothetical protein VIG89_09140 [Candidatus Acidoferrales bacterium]
MTIRKGPRKHVAQSTETDVLISSARRCCICFGLSRDFETKAGQIAHLDSDRTNGDLDNLAWLCLEHHNEYDGKTSQSKGLTPREVKTYRSLLYAEVSARLRNMLPEEKQPEALRLIERLHEPNSFLSSCMAEALTLARKAGDGQLESFCRCELSGYFDVEVPKFRVIDAFVSANRINYQHWIWAGDLNNAFEFMRRDPAFIWKRLNYRQSIGEIEAVLTGDVEKTLLVITGPMKDFIPSSTTPDVQVNVYLQPSSLTSILVSSRRVLTLHLAVLKGPPLS